MKSEKNNFEIEGSNNKDSEFHPVKITDSSLDNDENINKSFFSKIKSKLKFCKPEIFVTIIFILSFIFYYLSLQGCDKPEQKCLMALGASFFIQKTFLLIFSSFLTSIIISLSINKIISYHPTLYILFFYIVNFIIFRGMDLKNHGLFNTLGYIIFTPIFLLTNQIFMLCYRNHKQKKYLKNFLFFFIIFLPYLLIQIKSILDCNDWGDGIGGRKMLDDHGKSSCYIRKPKYCFKKIIDNKLDMNMKFNYNCPKKSKSFKENLLMYKGEQFKKTIDFAYPITTKYKDNETLHNVFMMKNIIDMYDINALTEEEKKLKEEPEIILHFNEDDSVDVNITIKPNKTLINERNKLYKKVDNKYENIIFIFCDGLSRRHLLRKLPETTKLLNKYFSINENNKNLKARSFQFFKYHNFAGFTDINIVPMFYGVPYLKKGIHFLNYYKENGYILAQSVNFCSQEVFPIYNFNSINVDKNLFYHENIAMFCDPNYQNPKSPFSSTYGPYSIWRKCLYGRDSFEYVFEYGNKFLEAYKNNPKFLKIGFDDPHESTSEVIKYIDNSMKNFIETIIENYFDNNKKSIIFLVSDHGNAMPDFSYIFRMDDSEIERVLGSLFIILPRNSSNLYNETALDINEQRFITPYDIHSTLLDVIKFNETNNEFSNLGQSLDKEINGMKRNCWAYQDFSHVKKDYQCKCDLFKDFSFFVNYD